MKFSPAIPRTAAAVLLHVLPACAAPKAAPITAPAVSNAPMSLKELERSEFQSPQDPALKLELARAYWCAGRHGTAVEHWKWIQQFAPRSTQADKARKLLKESQEDPDNVRDELSCVSPGG